MSNDNQIERVPDAVIPKRRAPALTRVLGSLVGWSMFIVLAVGALGFWAWSVYTNEGPLKESKVVVLPEGAGRNDISQLLEDQGVITDARVMNAASLVNSVRGGSLKPGEYEFPAGSTMASVLNTVASGKVLTYKLTVPEGWTTQMALERVNSNEVLTGPAITAVPSEAALIADTQVFRRGMTRAKLLEDMQAAQTKLVDDVWARKPADSVLRSKQELVTLASIVEKETAKADERPRVAAVFLNRLKQGMRLQSDPTIIYGIVGGVGKLDRPISRADIDGETPYNTYRINGLPPGPIAIPGAASLEAVINPAKTEELYFVADGTGGHAFAVTLDEHNANVKKWRDAQENGLKLPGDNNAKAEEPPAAPVAEIQQTPLPEVTATPAPEAAPAPTPLEDGVVAEAVKDAEKVQPVPEPEGEEAAAQPAAAAPKAAEPPATQAEAAPAKKPVKLVKLKPGSIVEVEGKKIPVPILKKARP